MPPKSRSKRPAPDAYDHLWSLLPVFIVFVAVIVFFAAVGEGLLPVDIGTTANASQGATKPVARN